MNPANLAELDQLKKQIVDDFDQKIKNCGGDPNSADSVATLVAVSDVILIAMKVCSEPVTGTNVLIALDTFFDNALNSYGRKDNAIIMIKARLEKSIEQLEKDE